jgi:hypothetical protein
MIIPLGVFDVELIPGIPATGVGVGATVLVGVGSTVLVGVGSTTLVGLGVGGGVLVGTGLLTALTKTTISLLRIDRRVTLSVTRTRTFEPFIDTTESISRKLYLP